METIRTFTNQAEAALIVSLLDSHGFDAVLLDQNSFQWNYAGAAIPIRLQVPNGQREAAIKFLETIQTAEEPAMTDDSDPDL